MPSKKDSGTIKSKKSQPKTSAKTKNKLSEEPIPHKQTAPVLDVGYLAGTILVSTPLIDNGVFNRSVIYVCAHDKDGAVGVVINRVISNVQWSRVLEQLKIESPTTPDTKAQLPIYFGGPLDADKGFILHSGEYRHNEMFTLHNNIAITPNTNLLTEILQGNGPKESLFMLGHAGWSAGQIENEIAQNMWVSLPADFDLIFHTDNAYKWNKAIKTLGINWYQYSTDVGHA